MDADGSLGFFLGGIVFVLFVVNLLSTGIGFVARDLVDSLVAKKEADVNRLLVIYGGCFALALPIRSLQYYLTQKLAIMWRRWLSLRLIRSYMEHRAYYDVNPNDEESCEIDNPDQRIADDTKAFTKESLRITVEAFDALLTFVLNIAVLWSISRVLTWALFAYSGAATLLLILASHKLVQINYDQLRYDADFRYGLVHIRDNAEAIAFYGGEGPETAECERRLGNVVTNFNRLIRWEVVISVLRRSYGYSGYFFPYVFLAGSYLRGELKYGEFVQAQFAFSQVESALSFVVSNIDDMAKWWAGISRLEGFQSAVDAINQRAVDYAEKGSFDANDVNDIEEALSPFCGSGRNPKSSAGIVLRNIRVRAPGSNHILVDDLSLAVGDGQRILVAGPSGCGKTSLLRVASGLWRPEVGEVERPAVGQMLFVPQRPYMLLGSLREQLCYPLPQDSFDDEDLRTALRTVALPHIANRYPDLSIKQDWPRVLSLGEQQRLAFARLLLNCPKFVVLDEATSALDVQTEQLLYDLLIERGVSVISVGHRPSLKAFHDQVLELMGDGGWRLHPAASYNFGGDPQPPLHAL